MKNKFFITIFAAFLTLSFSYAKDGEYKMEEITIREGGKNIYGIFYTPEKTDKNAKKSGIPLVILSHGFGGNHLYTEDYAREFAKNGFAAFSYDFVNGGFSSKSGNVTTKMSVLTEADDLEKVIGFFKNFSLIDKNRIFLFGESQGGFVSTYVAAKHPDDAAALVVFYPAYVLQDDSRKRNPDPQNGAETSSIMGVQVGKIYDVDAQSFDIYDVMRNFRKKTLIIHGTSDPIVPILYSERAQKTLADAKLIKIKGAGHGFSGSDKEKASKEAVKFLKEIAN